MNKKDRPGYIAAALVAIGLQLVFVPQGFARIQFTETTAQAGISDGGESVGAAWADLNNDGLPDIWLDKHQYTPTVVYLNRGNGTFEESIEAFDEDWGLLPAFEGRTDSHGRAFADFDNDGDSDGLEVSDLGWSSLFWVNDGSGRFSDAMAGMGFEYPFDPAICVAGNCVPWGRRMPVWLDYDRDGDLDVMISAVVDYAPPYSPTAIFKQIKSTNGNTQFVYAPETGIGYALSAFCRYGLLAELSGDDNLDMVCIDQSRATGVWDTTMLPFRDLRSRIGDALFSPQLVDVAVGDFDGDLRNDIFATRASFGLAVADTVGARTVHARFSAAPGAEGVLSFVADGDLLVDFDWNTTVRTVFLGGGRINPPDSSNLSAYNGWNNRVQLKLSANDPANQGIATSTNGGTYIGFANGRWTVRFVADASIGDPQIAVVADVSIGDLASNGSIKIGQPAAASPLLFLQDHTGLLVDRSERVNGPPSSCMSVTSGDYDNDGDLDLLAGCSGVIKNLDNILYENDGAGNFSAVTGSQLGDARGSIFGRTNAVLSADYDGDGRLDLFVVNGSPFRPFSYAARQQLLRNETQNSNHWVEVDLSGVTSNRDGIGARIIASTPDGKVQLREQGNGMHRDAQDYRRLHFGLGQNARVDLEVRWPSGVVDEFPNLPVDRIHQLVEGAGSRMGLACGAPTYDPAVDVGLYLWEEGCGNPERDFEVRAAAGGSEVMAYAGQVDADQALSAVTQYLWESDDRLDVLAGGAHLRYRLNVRDYYQDGFGFSAPADARVCFGLDLPSGTPVRVGPNATPLAAPFDLNTFEACVPTPPPPGVCGMPIYDPALDRGLFLWEENCGGANREYVVRGAEGGNMSVVTYVGQVDSDQPLTGLEGFVLESDDLLDLLNGGLRIRYRLNVRQQFQDGFAFSAADGAGVCFGMDLPAGTPVLVGPNATPVSAPFSLPDLSACVP